MYIFSCLRDRRSSKILGGYWNSHAGDITQVNYFLNYTEILK